MHVDAGWISYLFYVGIVGIYLYSQVLLQLQLAMEIFVHNVECVHIQYEYLLWDEERIINQLKCYIPYYYIYISHKNTKEVYGLSSKKCELLKKLQWNYIYMYNHRYVNVMH